jgi:hypothetical protein
VPDFPWAERHKAEVCDVPLVLIGGILPPDGSAVGAELASRKARGIVLHAYGHKANASKPEAQAEGNHVF